MALKLVQNTPNLIFQVLCTVLTCKMLFVELFISVENFILMAWTDQCTKVEEIDEMLFANL